MFRLYLNNFRSFIKQEFDFSRINVLIGENSSGKSSLIKFLLMLEKSQNITDQNFTFQNQLGKYKNFVHANDDGSRIEFGLYAKGDYFDFIEYALGTKDDGWKKFVKNIKRNDAESACPRIHVSFSKDVRNPSDVGFEISNELFGSIKIVRIQEGDDILNKTKCNLIVNLKGKEFTISDIAYSQEGFFSFINTGQDIENYLEEHGLSLKLYYQIAYLLVSQNYFQALFNRFEYVNPIESVPERIYQGHGDTGLRPVRSIEDVILTLTSERIEKRTRNKLTKSLRTAMRLYGIIDDLKIVKSENVDVNEVKVKTPGSDQWDNIVDVGYGTTLLIPVFFQAIISDIVHSKGEIVIIEQPEIHVHPSLQSRFIETLLQISEKNSYFIETHSPDIVRKLQSLIKNKDAGIKPQDVVIHYFKKSREVSEVSVHHINEHGKMIPRFPEGFYDSQTNIVKELF